MIARGNNFKSRLWTCSSSLLLLYSHTLGKTAQQKKLQKKKMIATCRFPRLIFPFCLSRSSSKWKHLLDICKGSWFWFFSCQVPFLRSNYRFCNLRVLAKSTKWDFQLDLFLLDCVWNLELKFMYHHHPFSGGFPKVFQNFSHAFQGPALFQKRSLLLAFPNTLEPEPCFHDKSTPL